jgi:hypothetical protein
MFKDGETPLHEAVKTQTMDVIENLIDLGMSPVCKNKRVHAIDILYTD